MKINLRPYQNEAVDGVRNEFKQNVRSVLYQLATGGGKTFIFSYITKLTVENNKRVLILVHRVELLRQASKSLKALGIEHGLISPKYTPNPTALVQVASVQTLIRRMDKVPDPSLIIIDECFPAGTIIDGKEIQNIKVGDYVKSFNHDIGDFEHKEVLKLHKRQYDGDYYKFTCSDGSDFVCTENHPIYVTDKGYVKAKDINKKDILIHENIGSDNLHELQERNLLYKEKNTSTLFKNRSRLLFRGMSKNSYLKNFKRNYVKNKSKIRFRKNEEKQSDVKSRNFKKDDKLNERSKIQRAWRKWKNNITSTNVSRCNWIQNGTRYKYERSSTSIRKSILQLQTRFSLSEKQISNRSGWKESSKTENKNFRQEKRTNIKGVRVVHIEVYKSGSNERPEWLPKENTVYNLHVKDNLNYFANGILVHNCHHAIAGSWRKVIDYYSNARILGVTATPCRTDNKPLSDVFDTMVQGPQIYDLIEMGFLVKPVVYGCANPVDLGSVRIKGNDYDKDEVAELLDRPKIIGSAVEHYTKLCPNEPCVVFCVSVKHAENVAEEFRQSGYIARSVDGAMDDSERSYILDGLGNGNVEVVTSCDLISEGTDIPAIKCAILLRPTHSESLFIQQVGRALRKSEGKTEAIILDHVGNCARHRLPDSHRDWSLEGKKKITKKRAAEMMEKAKQCEACYQVYEPAPECPYCGHKNAPTKRELEQIEGELKLLTEKNTKKQKRMEVGRANSLEELQRIGRERGYKPGWAYGQWQRKVRKKFG